MSIEGISHITLAVRDLEKSRSFYKKLGLKETSYEENKDCHLLAGNEWFVLVYDKKAKPAVGYTHIAFSVEANNFKNFIENIKMLKVKCWNSERVREHSFYFNDPDGHQLEIRRLDQS